MSEIVGKLLVLARSDAGSEPLNVQDVDVTDLLAELGQDIEALAQEKGLKLSFGPDGRPDGQGRPGQAEAAVPEHPRQRPPLHAGRRHDHGLGRQRRDDQAVATIGDTGIGIPEEHLPFIFDRFYRVDKVRTDGEGGTGLGLSIATSIARMHGGTIEVESRGRRAARPSAILLPLAGPPSKPPTTTLPLRLIPDPERLSGDDASARPPAPAGRPGSAGCPRTRPGRTSACAGRPWPSRRARSWPPCGRPAARSRSATSSRPAPANMLASSTARPMIMSSFVQQRADEDAERGHGQGEDGDDEQRQRDAAQVELEEDLADDDEHERLQEPHRATGPGAWPGRPRPSRAARRASAPGPPSSGPP